MKIAVFKQQIIGKEEKKKEKKKELSQAETKAFIF